ncbi:oxysterol-binding protein-related protein 1 [Sinocyclocheilus anshuiensis]|uniref:oxysterol-binding protein-related protein 1 n=1 Tax=Sinocyclocheilus anshuiensis TaxID=1608454 RepID=UPI0007BA686E|nr:PREDICTED: oxysterol-binding protein-related protein 1-like [Sinocyclocheilus anshuiensis]
MEELDPEEHFLRDARNGNLEGIQKLLMSKIKEEAEIDINCKGKSKSNHGWTPLHLACYFGHKDVVEALLKAGADANLPNNVGDTPLHKAAFTGRKEVVMLLLQYDACASVINGMAQIPKDITQSAEIKSMLEAAERTEERKLEEQLLEAAREGAISTLTRLLNMKKPPNINCTDLLGNTPLHCAAYRGQKQCAVKLLQHKANPNIKNKIDQTVFDLANDAEMKQIITGNVMKGMTRHVKMFEGPLWKSSRFFGWRSYWVVLQDGVLSWYPKQSDADSNTHRQACKPLTQAQCMIKAKDNSYFTIKCFDNSVHHFKVSQKNNPEAIRKRWLEAIEEHSAFSTHYCSQDPDSEEEEDNVVSVHELSDSLQLTSLPAPMFSRNDFSIWSILRKCIGMELSKITMPVIFNEPLSFLQRLTEYMEHTYLIHQANTSDDSIERMKCVAAFAVSAVASQWERTGKPFNPLLGETYELVRDDLGFRLISEQVSHHPPISAFHAEGLQKDFVFHGSIYPKLKFWGKSVEAEPKGIITLELPKHNEAYTWMNPTCCVHNIIVGQLWIEQYGNVEVINHRTGEKCCLSFKPCGLFGKELHKVEGYILDKSKKKVCNLYGKWTECMYIVDTATFETHKKNEKKASEDKKSSKQSSQTSDSEETPQPGGDSLEVIPGSQLLWRIAPRPVNSAQMYNFTTFAMQLDELDKEIEAVIPKTDSRLRPDIRAMENGDIDLASEEKKRLEEKQRAARKNRSKSDDEWKTRNVASGPRWFYQGPNPHNGSQDWLFSNGYWDRDYSQVPDIY